MIPNNRSQLSEDKYSPINLKRSNENASITPFLCHDESNINSINNQTSSSQRSSSSSSRIAQNMYYRSPSYFLDFGNVQAFSPSQKSPQSHLGSTYTAQHNHLLCPMVSSRREISRFDADAPSPKSSTPKILNIDSPSPLICKTEEPTSLDIEEVRRENQDIFHQRQFPRMQTRIQLSKKRKCRQKEELLLNEQEVKLQKERKPKQDLQGDVIESRKISQKQNSKEEDNMMTAKIENQEQTQKQLVKVETIEEEVSVLSIEESKENQTFEVSEVFENFEIESDSQEVGEELLTEAETLEALRANWGANSSPLTFLSENEKNDEIDKKCVLNDDGLRFEGNDELLFFCQGNLRGGKILSLSSDLLSVPAQTFKRISKVYVESYRCKYCGRIFEKGCALGGHISRVHKGESEDFKYRQQSITKRISDRTRGKILRKESMKQLQ